MVRSKSKYYRCKLYNIYFYMNLPTDCYDTMPLKWCVDAREKNVCNAKKVKAKCKMTCGHC